jgi:hypothetical protein
MSSPHWRHLELGYLLLRRFLNDFDAVAIAATYGPVSAVTFITTVQYLDTQGIQFGGHMAAAMALMESPAIVLAVVLANHARRKAAATADIRHAIPEASPSLYFGMSLGLTFPFNILVGIPLYVHAAQLWL